MHLLKGRLPQLPRLTTTAQPNYSSQISGPIELSQHLTKECFASKGEHIWLWSSDCYLTVKVWE